MMIQDLEGRKLYNEYERQEAESDDSVFFFDMEKMYIKTDEDGEPDLLTASDFPNTKLLYLFRIEEKKYFLAMDESDKARIEAISGVTKTQARNLRDLTRKELAFAAATAYHLYQWYRDNKYCGRCGFSTQHGSGERMLKCPSCGNSIYPKIAPAVIVGLIDGDRLLMTKYNGRAYKRYALIAGFTEIGETAEETVIREVREEVGLNAKNVRYYKSQPWGTEQDLLLGYFCDLDGDDTISLDEDELSTAVWVHRDDMNMEEDGFSLTREMMCAFQRGEV